MKTIKKTTLIAAITAMAAIAVPAMASAAVWAPLNTNKTLTAHYGDNAIQRQEVGGGSFGVYCAQSTFGVHVRSPASSTLDITSASYTDCHHYGTCGAATVTATGLPWPVTTTGTNVTFTEHLQITSGCFPAGVPPTLTSSGPVTGSYSNATHTLTAAPLTGTQPGGMRLYLGAFNYAALFGAAAAWKDATNTLTLT